MNSSALNSIKTFFGYRNRHYQSVSQIDAEESKCIIDENTSCIDDKPSFIDRTENINSKQIDEILPLINETSFNLKNTVRPISAYTNDTRPDVDILDY